MTDPSDGLGVGIAGAGLVACNNHVPDIREAGGRVVALADTGQGVAARAAERLQVPHAFEDYRALLALDEVAIVAVCTPPVSHAEIAIAAFEAGKHVYLEKPPAINEEEMLRITAAGHRAGRLLLSGANAVYHDDLQTLKRTIDAGELGSIFAIEALMTGRGWLPEGWGKDRGVAGGGVVMGQASHRLDWALFLLGSPRPVSVTARTYSEFAAFERAEDRLRIVEANAAAAADPKRREIEETMMALVQFENGCTLLTRHTWSPFLPDEIRMSLFGTRGGASLRPLVFHGRRSDGTLTDVRAQLPEPPKGSHTQAYRHLFQCIREGRSETGSPGERSILVMRIIDAIYRSASLGGSEARF